MIDWRWPFREGPLAFGERHSWFDIATRLVVVVCLVILVLR